MSKFFSKEAFAVMHIRNFRLFLAYRFFMTSATLINVAFLFAYKKDYYYLLLDKYNYLKMFVVISLLHILNKRKK